MTQAVIFDWKQTLYDPSAKNIISGSKELLDFLAQNSISMFLVGKGDKEMYGEVQRLGVDKYFSHVYFNVGAKEPDWYTYHIPGFHKGMLFVGDKPDSEIEVGNRLGAVTIRIKQGKFADMNPMNARQQATYTVDSLQECLTLLKGHILQR